MHIQSLSGKETKNYPTIKIGTNMDDIDGKNTITEDSSAAVALEDTNSLSN